MKDNSQGSAVPLLTGLVRTIRDCCQQKSSIPEKQGLVYQE